MKTSVIAGVVLAVLVVFWTLVMGFTGWYKSPTMVAAFFLVIPINIGVVIWGLRKTAREGRGYGGQIAAALVMGVVASVFIFANSFVFTTVLFPTYFDDLRAVQAELLKAAGQSDKEIEGQLALTAGDQTHMSQATAGVLGTMGTTLVTALIAAAFIRKK